MVRLIQNQLAEAAIQSRDEFRQFQLLLLCETIFSQTALPGVKLLHAVRRLTVAERSRHNSIHAILPLIPFRRRLVRQCS